MRAARAVFMVSRTHQGNPVDGRSLLKIYRGVEPSISSSSTPSGTAMGEWPASSTARSALPLSKPSRSPAGPYEPRAAPSGRDLPWAAVLDLLHVEVRLKQPGAIDAHLLKNGFNQRILARAEMCHMARTPGAAMPPFFPEALHLVPLAMLDDQLADRASSLLEELDAQVHPDQPAPGDSLIFGAGTAPILATFDSLSAPLEETPHA